MEGRLPFFCVVAEKGIIEYNRGACRRGGMADTLL